MDAIITAGGKINQDDPLHPYAAHENQKKALLDVAGKPMIQWVVDAVCSSDSVENIVVIGFDETPPLSCRKQIVFMPDQGGMIQNIRTAIHKVREIHPGSHHVLVVSSDIPGITTEMVDWTIHTALETDHDIYYNVITKEVMETRYPTSKRSYIHLRDMDICGGDMNVIRTHTVTSNDELWERIVAARKSALRQASLIGWDTLFLLLFRLISLDRGVKMATKRLNITGRVLVCPYAEVGMDVDKPHQLEIMRADLAQRVVT